MLSIENPDYTRANEVMDGHEKRTFEMIDEVIHGRRQPRWQLREGVERAYAQPLR